MRLGIFAKTFAGTDPASVLAQAAAAGYETVQYNMACSGLPAMPDEIAPGVAEAVALTARAAGLGICAVSGTYNMAHPDPGVRQKGLARLEILAAAAARLGTGTITLCTGSRDPDDQWRHHPLNDTPQAWADMYGEMEKAVRIAERHGIRLGIEPELGNIVSSAAKARRLLDDMQSPALAIVLDAANLFETADPDTQRRIVAEAIELLADHIVMAHAKDRAADGRFVRAGAGVLDYRHYLASLRAGGFTGDLVTHGLSDEEAPRVAGFLKEMM